MNRLGGRQALVRCAASGIGREFASYVSEEAAATVSLLEIDEEEVEDVRRHLPDVC